MKFKHILTTHQYEIEDVLKLLNSGKPFDALAQKFSICSSASSGGDLGEVLKSKNVNSDFRETCENLKTGEISKALRTRFGYHVILRYE